MGSPPTHPANRTPPYRNQPVSLPNYEPAGELKIGQVGIANLKIRTLDIAALAEEMRRAGFHEVSYRAMTGGIVFLHAGVKAL